MGPEVVVMGHEVPKPLLGLREILGLHPFPELLAHRGPKPLGFAYRLGVVGPGHYVLDAFTFEKLLEVAFSPPGEILAALVG